MCYPASEFLVGDHDVKLGEIGGAPFFMSASQSITEAHATRHRCGERPGGMFSLENGSGLRFLSARGCSRRRSRAPRAGRERRLTRLAKPSSLFTRRRRLFCRFER